MGSPEVVCKRCYDVIYKRGVAPADIAAVVYLCGPLCQRCADQLEEWWFQGLDFARGRA